MCRGVDDLSTFLSNTFLRNELFFWRGAEIKIIGQKRFVTQIYITLEDRGILQFWLFTRIIVFSNLHVTSEGSPRYKIFCAKRKRGVWSDLNGPRRQQKQSWGTGGSWWRHQGGTNGVFDIASNIEKLHLSLHIVDWMFFRIIKFAFFLTKKRAWIFFQMFFGQVVSGGGLRVNHDIVLRKVLWTSKYPGQVHICRQLVLREALFYWHMQLMLDANVAHSPNIFVFMHGKFRCCCRGVLHWWYHPPISAQPSTEHVGMSIQLWRLATWQPGSLL